MTIKQLSEVLYKVYTDGRAKATAMKLTQNDITQMVMLAYGGLLRDRYKESKKLDEFGEPDYSIISPVLDIKEFKLSEANGAGMRRADMSKYDIYRLPKNGHITNISMVGGACTTDEIGNITLVQPGEEKFYLKPKYNFFKFGAIVGRGINFYHIPDCVTKIEVETSYNSDDADVSMDIGVQIFLQVMGVLFKEKQFPIKVLDNSMDPNVIDLRRRLTSQAAATQEQPID